jgi:hypothetical protein
MTLHDQNAELSSEDLLRLSAEIVAAYVSQNSVPAANIPDLVRSVHGAVTGLGSAQPVRSAEKQKPAVPISRSIQDDYLDDSFIYVTEGDEIQTKAELLKDFRPLPKGVTGSITITNYKATVFGDFAVATHVDEESEHIYGQDLHPRYLTTDTWKRTPDGWRLVMQHVKVVLDEPPAQALPQALLDEYAGTYEAEGLAIRLRRDGDHLLAERDGRPPVVLKAEARDVFFVPGRPRERRVFQRDGSGKITGYADRREGHDIVMTRKG